MRNKLLATTALALVLVLFYFPLRFALTFELLGYAVTSPSAGWLGPTPRNAGNCVVDAGKVNVWQCQDTSVFAKHRFGCKLWLDFFGYSGA